MTKNRFRFRIWDIKRKQMLDLCLDYFLGNPGYIIEQCTDLVDENSRYIFEGDLVKDIESGELAEIKFGESRGYQCFYPFWLGKFSAQTKYNPGWRTDLCFWCYTKNIEVVGNIHENPELLEANNGNK